MVHYFLISSCFFGKDPLIIFTITNKISGKIYVGHTRNKLHKQWEKIVDAANNQLDFPLYHEIRVHGSKHFSVDEYEYADTLEEAKKIEKEVIELFNANSLRGYKTSNVVIKKGLPKKKNSKLEADIKKLFVVNSLSENDIETALIFEQDLKYISRQKMLADGDDTSDDASEQAVQESTADQQHLLTLTQKGVVPGLKPEKLKNEPTDNFFVNKDKLLTNLSDTDLPGKKSTFEFSEQSFSFDVGLTRQPDKKKEKVIADTGYHPPHKEQEKPNNNTESVTDIAAKTEEMVISDAIIRHRATLCEPDAAAKRNQRKVNIKIMLERILEKENLIKRKLEPSP